MILINDFDPSGNKAVYADAIRKRVRAVIDLPHLIPLLAPLFCQENSWKDTSRTTPKYLPPALRGLRRGRPPQECRIRRHKQWELQRENYTEGTLFKRARPEAQQNLPNSSVVSVSVIYLHLFSVIGINSKKQLYSIPVFSTAGYREPLPSLDEYIPLPNSVRKFQCPDPW